MVGDLLVLVWVILVVLVSILVVFSMLKCGLFRLGMCYFGCIFLFGINKIIKKKRLSLIFEKFLKYWIDSREFESI